MIEKLESYEAPLSTDEAVKLLASGLAVSADEMRALLERAWVRPPTSRSKIDRLLDGDLLGLLQRKAAQLEADRERAAVGHAFATCHVPLFRQTERSPAELLQFVSPKARVLRLFAERWRPEAGGAIVIGPTGCGKSIVAFVAMARAIVDHARETRRGPMLEWCSCDALDLGLAAQRSSLSRTPELVARAKRASGLVLDDLGWEREFHRESVLEVAAHRYKHGLPTIVTSGKTYDELEQIYGRAVLRRFLGPDGKIVNAWGAA